MLENSKQEILDRNYFLNKRKDAKKKTDFTGKKHRFFLLAVFMAFVLLAVLYFVSPYSCVYHVTAEGNRYYSDGEIRAISGINDTDRFLLVSTAKASGKLKKDPLIKNCEVIKKDGNVISINVEEYKMIGYIYEDGVPYVLLENDTRIELNKDNMKFIYEVPLIEGYTKEELLSLEKGFKDVPYEVIREMSEIHKYPFSYDEKMMEVIMKDGNYVFVSSIGLDLLNLNSYYTAVSKLELSDKKACVYLDEVTETMQYRKCPWEKEDEVIIADNNE